MDAVAALAGQLAGILSPYLPQLQAAAAGQLESQAGKLAARLWQTLAPAVSGRPAAAEAAGDVASDPKDEDNVAAFRKELRKLLADSPELARTLQELVSEGERSGVVQVNAQGARAVAIGGQASGAIIVSGNDNTIER